MLTPPVLYVRAAVPEDLATLRLWREETAAWLERRYGIDQWSKPFWERRGLALIEQGATVMATLEPFGQPVATYTMLPYGNPRLWTPDELGVPARYLHKGNVDRVYGGCGIGAHLYDWARSRAARDGAEVVRSNVWTRNVRLHEYYLAQGRRLVRTVPGMLAGTLFEAPAVFLPDLPVAEVGEIELPA